MSTALNESGTDESSPLLIRDYDDPGDEVQRNFRYQHAYGGILLVASIRGRLPYIALWCEHHEDFLGEREGEVFDAFQIKTGTPEHGHWTLRHDGLRASMRRFVRLGRRLGEHRIGRLIFVSNVDFLKVGLDVKDRVKLGRSPVTFLEVVHNVNSPSELPPPFDDTFREIKRDCRCTDAELFSMLKRMHLQKGPGRDSFDAEIAHDHISKLPSCSGYPPARLNSIRDELIQRVYLASSLRIADPQRHYHAASRDGLGDPAVREKRLSTEEVADFLSGDEDIPFRFYPGAATLAVGDGRGNLTRLQRKMTAGGLSSQVLTMQRRALSAEAHLMEVAHQAPEAFSLLIDQLVSVVQGECDEAYLAASLSSAEYGPTMLVDLHRRLRALAEQRPTMVHHEAYETLIGVAGLLSGECKVWWSAPLDVDLEAVA